MSSNSGRLWNRRAVSITLAVLMIVLPCTIVLGDDDSSAETHSGSYGGIEWTLDDEGTLRISGNGETTDEGGSDSYGEYKDVITSVIIENGITGIGTESFINYPSITYLSIPGTVGIIGYISFSGCNSLKTVVLHDGLEQIYFGAFLDCTSLESIIIPDSTTYLWNDVLKGCTGLQRICFGDGLAVGEYVYGGISDIQFYDSDGETFLDNGYYDNFRGKVFVKVGDKLIKQPEGGAINETIMWYYNNGVLNICGTGDMENYANADEQPWESLRGSIQNISISEGITSVGNYAFYQCGHATSITIPNSVRSIGSYSLSYCNGITTIDLPDEVSYIGDYAFMEAGMTSMNIPEGMTTIGEKAFRYCNSLTSLTIPDTVTSIGDEAFLGCINLRDIFISRSLTEISPNAFNDVNLYDTDGETLIEKDVTHLKGTMFVNKSNKAVKLHIGLTVDGAVCIKTSDTYSASLTNDDFLYLKKMTSLDDRTELRVLLKDGITASFDKAAIVSFGNSDASLTIAPVDNSTLNETIRTLVGDYPVYDITFGGNTNFGEGRCRIEIPLGDDVSDVKKVMSIKDNEVAGTADFIFKDGKVSFTTDELSMICIETETASGNEGQFPLWIPIVSVAGVLAIAGVTFFILRWKK